MTKKQRQERAERRAAYADRRDNRRPQDAEPLDAVRKRARDERRKARREVNAR